MQGRRTKRPGRFSVDHELEIDVMVGEIEEIERLKEGLEFSPDERRVLDAQAKGNEGAGVPQNRMSHVRF